MANVYLSLAVPAGDGLGAATDTSSMGPEKSISVDGGAFSGELIIEGSNDAGVTFDGVPGVFPFIGPTQIPITIKMAFQFMRVRRRASDPSNLGAPTVKLAGASPGTANLFGALPAPAGSVGTGAPFDLTTGGDTNTFVAAGAFTGQVFVELSNDGVNFSGGLLFLNRGMQTVLGTFKAARLRVVGIITGALPTVAVGSGTDGGGGGGGGFPGFGAAPPAVALASAAGISGLAAQSDHTHAATVLNLLAGAGISLVNVAGAWTIAATIAAFGGAPPAVASASAAGAAATASRSDHTHAQDLSVVYAPSLAAGQASGVFQQTYAAPNATPSVLTMVATQIPFGAAATGLLTQSANLKWSDVAGAETLTLTSATDFVQANMAITSANGTVRSTWSVGGTSVAIVTAAKSATPVNTWQFTLQQASVAALNGDQYSIRGGSTVSGNVINVFTQTYDVMLGIGTHLAVGAVNGFVFLPTVNGAPTTAPTYDASGAAGTRRATVLDDVNLRWYAYIAGAWHFSAFNDFAATTARVPFGGATAGTLTDSAGLTFTTATTLLTIGVSGVTPGAVKINGGPGGISIGGGGTASLVISDSLGGGASSIAVDDYFFGQNVIGWTNGALTGLSVGVGAGQVLALSYAMDRNGAHTDALTVQGTGGAVQVGDVSFTVGVTAPGLQILFNAAGDDTFLGSSAALAAGATHGYPYIPNVAARPTGAPNAFGGVGAAIAYNRANEGSLVAYDTVNGILKDFPAFSVTLAGGAGVLVTTNAPAGFGLTPKWWNFHVAGVNIVVPYLTNP